MNGDEVKIVVVQKGERALVGIQKPDCDPVIATIEGDLPEVLATVPRLVDEARARWETSPKYPKCETNLTPPAPTPAARSVARAPEPKAQPTMF